jgi:hypothetical protein
MKMIAAVLGLALVLAVADISVAGEAAKSPYAQWKNGLSADASTFPIAVWLQDPRNAAKYKAAGINLFIGLWKGPTEEQLAALKDAGMPIICEQNEVGLKHKDDRTIVGWMHGDEPDNAQDLPDKKGYGPPILPEKIVADYERIRKADPTRPVMLNLGQGVAWDGWYGRGPRTNHPEDYAEYAKGGDLISFDIYPVVHDKPDVKGKLWFVPKGVDRLREWTKGEKVVWNCIECTRIGSDTKATPREVRCEVWMSLIHGSQGLIYFVHEFKPKFCEWALLNDPEMLAGVAATNKQIAELAPALNSPTVKDGAAVASENKEVPVDAVIKKAGGATCVFAVAMRPGATKATFTVAGLTGKKDVEVLGENRKLAAEDGKFADEFKDWDVHLYRLP